MAIAANDKHGRVTKARWGGRPPAIDKATLRYFAVVNRGRTWSRGFRSRRDAQTEERRLLGELDAGVQPGRDRITLAEFIEQEWLPRERRRVELGNLDANTLQHTEIQVNAHIVPSLGHRKLRDIKPKTLQEFYLERKETRGWKSAKTLLNLHTTISGILQLAVDDGLLPRNPATVRGVRPSDRNMPSARPPDALTKEEVAKLMLYTDDDRLAAAWRLVLAGGLRRGEALGLEWRDIDFDRRTVRLERTWKTMARTREHVVGPIKTGHGRTIAIDERTAVALQTHRDRQSRERARAGDSWNDTGAVFTDEVGRRIVPTTFSRRFARLLTATVRRGRLHELRHTAVTHALREGMRISVAAERFGHSPAVMHNVYTQVSDEDRAAAAEIAGSIFE